MTPACHTKPRHMRPLAGMKVAQLHASPSVSSSAV